jgi:hypothetical protein
VQPILRAFPYCGTLIGVCKRLFDYYGISTNEAKRYHDLQVVDGIMVVEMG